MKRGLLTLALLLLPVAANAADNIGSCGWGAKLMDGNKGIAPQVLAVTTNGTSGNQTFGISSGTSGCTQDGVVHSSWKTAMFIDANKNKFASDASRGEGETLQALAALIGVDQADQGTFFSATKDNFASIFPRDNVSTEEVVSNLKAVLAANSSLAKYSSLI